MAHGSSYLTEPLEVRKAGRRSYSHGLNDVATGLHKDLEIPSVSDSRSALAQISNHARLHVILDGLADVEKTE